MRRIGTNEEALELIRSRIEFTNRTRTFRAQVLHFHCRHVSMDRNGDVCQVAASVHDQDNRYFDMQLGLLPVHFADNLTYSGFTLGNLYVVYSYNTPIGYTFFDPHHTHWAMHIPSIRYGSRSITQHQAILYSAESQRRNPHGEITVPVPDLRSLTDRKNA